MSTRRGTGSMDVGSELRQERERQGLSLHELSARTKIGVSSLRAIESNEVERLPGGIFTRGFLKAYAREVGLDPIDIADRYTSQFEAPPAPLEASANRVLTTDQEHESGAAHVSRYSGAIIAMGALVLVAACFFALSRLQTVGSPSAAAAPPAEAAAPAAREEVGTTGSPMLVPAPSESGLRVELQSSGECWMSATADGKRLVYRLMQPGERQTIDVRDALELRVGDPSTCGFSINGTPGRPLGRAGEAVTVTITPDNYRSFIRQ